MPTVEKRRKMTGVREDLSVVCLAMTWEASEIHILQDKFLLELPSKPNQEDKINVLADLLHYVELTSVQLSGDFVQDTQAVFEHCREHDLFLVRIFVYDVSWFFGGAGVPLASSFMGVRVDATDAVPAENVVYGLSSVPLGPLRTVQHLLQGEVPEV